MSLSLKVHFVALNSTKTVSLNPSATVGDACELIKEKYKDQDRSTDLKDFGLFLPDNDNGTGVWLEPAKKLEYYILRNGDTVEFKKKIRTLKIKMLDGTQKTILVDDSQIVANMMVAICVKLGITNHDEYSLVVEDPTNDENIDNRNYGTLTLKRRKEEKDKDAKMEQLKRKLHTDDEVNWVDSSKTLREQGIGEGVVVLLKRKYFFSDQNIDSHDPVQLNLLYVQARDAIINGTHPIVQEQACEFAGIQCQIQFGDHAETKHKPGLFELKEFLPSSYVKIKGIEKKIFNEHRKHTGLSEVEAKVLYTKKARELKTYGVTFFLVKEKMKGKNKLVPRLLGVTKDSVLRLDEKTKEILHTWPLKTVRRWGASPNTFTLDFGDYSDQYYSVQTTEAEQIQQIIAGYIDIILKKKRAIEHFGIEGDEGSTMFEESVAPHKATILQHESSKVGKINTESLAKPAIMRAGTDGQKTFSTGVMSGAQYTTIGGQANVGYSPSTIQQTKITSVLTEPQRALSSTISATHSRIKESEIELEARAQIPELGTDPGSKKWIQTTLDTHKQKVGSSIATMNAATAQVVTLTSGPIDEVDHHAVGAAITTIGDKLPEMTKDVKMIAALMDDTSMGDKLLDATRKLCHAFSDLLKAAEPESKEPRQSLLDAASRVGEASTNVLATIGEDTIENKELQDMLLSLAKAVANATAALLLKAKNIASSCEDQQTQNRVIGAATQCALATSQLVACAKVIAPTLSSPQCQEQLKAAVREVAKAVENLVAVCNEASGNDDSLNELRNAAREVTRTLNELLQRIHLPTRERAQETVQEYSVEEIYTATDKLSAASDANEMVKQARRLGQATAQLIQSIKGEAEKTPDSDIQKRLLAAAKTLADATARMVEAARQCAVNPHDVRCQDTLRQTAEDLRSVTMIAATTPALRAKLVDKVKVCAKRAVVSAHQCITAAKSSGEYNTNPTTREALEQETEELSKQVQALFNGIKESSDHPEDTRHQVDLIYVADVFLHPATHFVQTSQSALPTIHEHTITQQLSTTSQKLNTDLTELSSALSRAKPVCQGLGLDAAAQLIADLQDELNEFEAAVKSHQLRPLPGDRIENGATELSASSKSINQGVAQLISATKQGNEIYTDKAAKDTAESLRALTGAIRSIAATSDNNHTKLQVIHSGQDVLLYSSKLVDEAQKSLRAGTLSSGLENTAKKIENALTETINCLPGQKDVDSAITDIIQWSSSISTSHFPSTTKTYGELQHELSTAAANLNEASSVVVRSVSSPTQLASSSKDFSAAFHELLDVSMEMAGQAQDREVQGQMVHSLKNVSTSSSTLLTTAKLLSADPYLPNGRNQLLAAARAVTETINSLVNVCTSAVPGQTECDNAIRKIQAMRHLLDNPTEQINDFSYYDALDSAIENGHHLGECMREITLTAKQSQHEKFAEQIKLFSATICQFVEAAAQTAYLVGVSDPTSIAGRPGLVDQAQFARASQAIQQACASLSSSSSPPKEILESATLIAKHTSALCNSCRTASSKTTNPVAKRQFVQSAKAVANSTSNLVTEIKKLDLNYSDENRQRCADATRPLLDAVQKLCVYANSSEFISIPARISAQGNRAQQPILEAGRSLIDSSCNIIRVSKNLIVMNKDPSTWQNFASTSKNVSDSIKQLIHSVKDGAPGGNECEIAATTLENYLKTLNSASMDAINQSLVPKKGATLPDCSQRVERAAAELLESIEPLRQSAKFEAANIGRNVNQMIQYFKPLVQSAIDAASLLKNTKQQEQLLDQAKSVTESVLQLVYSTKDCGGNPKAVNVHPDIDEFAASSREALQDLVSTLETISTQSGAVSSVIDNLTRAMTKLSDQRASLIYSDSENYVDYQTRMVECAKQIAKLASEISLKTTSDPQKLGPLFVDLSHKYNQLANDSQGAAAAAAATNGEVAMRLREDVQQLGGACVELVDVGGQCLIKTDEHLVREVGKLSSNVAEKVSRVLATLQSGSRGTQACINAASTVSGIIGDLETTIMFATAGNLNSEHENESFADHRENILKTAKALVDDTKTLVAGAAAPQEELAVAAQNSVATIVQLAEVVKLGAASLGSDNRHSQEMLINAVKDVASALGDLIHATKAASGKSIHDPAMSHLKESAKVMVTNVTSLLKTVKAVEDEHTRGTRALESTIEAILQEMKALSSSDGCRPNVTAEDLVRCTKAITNATAKSVAAGISNKQDDIIVAANLARKSISDMLIICKSAAYNLAETTEIREKTLQAGHDCAYQFRELLLTILNGNGADIKQSLAIISRNIAHSAKEIVNVAALLKGSDWVDPNDPTVIAENELLGAAATIDAAAKKLADLRPRKSIKTQNPDDSLNFDEMIIDAAKSITAATSALVRAACAAQRELIDSGKVSRTPISSSDDGQWSEGLISAARLVAAATHSLVESANALVQGLGSEDKLISSAKQVASSTAQLLVACKVKAEGDTEATRRLHQAGTAVIRSTDNLVRAAQKSQIEEEERSLVLNKRIVGGIAQEIDARSEVFRIERELAEARSRLNAIRQAKYKLKGGETTSGDETDGYISSAQDGETSRYAQYQYDSSQSNYSPTLRTVQYDHSNFSHLESPHKVNSLERNKTSHQQHYQQQQPLYNINSQINALDNAVYGNSGNYSQNYQPNYESFSKNAPKFTSDNNYNQEYVSPAVNNTTYYSKPSPGQPQKPSFTTFDKPQIGEKPNLTSFQRPPSSDAYTTSEYATNTYKIPGGYKTDSYKYESYKSQPTYSTSSEKYITQSSQAPISPFDKKSFETFKNGSDNQYQTSYTTSNVEYINEPPILKDTDTLEQKMLKKSVTQQIVEKKTVQMTKSSQHESSMKTFRFD